MNGVCVAPVYSPNAAPSPRMLLKGAARSAVPLCTRALSSALQAASRTPAAPSGAAPQARRIATVAAQAQGASASSSAPAAAMAPAAVVAAGELPEALRGLQPEGLWRHFATLSSIPRPSKHEGRCVHAERSTARWGAGRPAAAACCRSAAAARPCGWPPAAACCSLHRVIEWLKSFAEERGLEWQQVRCRAGGRAGKRACPSVGAVQVGCGQ